ncbi:hypothetical protein, partial [Dokdonella sp.]|uniref:hypothetical protein n=1 Tax=Dokdonella sp. TaxID=2291710 RepID=UPI003C3813E9
AQRRRVSGGGTDMKYWLVNNGDDTQVVLVSDEAVYSESVPASRAGTMVEQLKSGNSPARTFSEDATHIVLRDTRRVKQSSSDNDIDFNTGEGKQAKEISLSIEDGGIRDEVFGSIEHETEGRFRRYEDSYTRPRAAVGSLTGLTVFGFGTVLLMKAAAAIQVAEEIEVTGRKRGLKQFVVWLLDTLGPTGVGIIGGLICALCLWVLVQRLKAPPHLQILQPKPYQPQRALVTALKYIALFAIWALFLPPLLR